MGWGGSACAAPIRSRPMAGNAGKSAKDDKLLLEPEMELFPSGAEADEGAGTLAAATLAGAAAAAGTDEEGGAETGVTRATFPLDVVGVGVVDVVGVGAVGVRDPATCGGTLAGGGGAVTGAAVITWVVAVGASQLAAEKEDEERASGTGTAAAKSPSCGASTIGRAGSRAWSRPPANDGAPDAGNGEGDRGAEVEGAGHAALHFSSVTAERLTGRSTSVPCRALPVSG